MAAVQIVTKRYMRRYYNFGQAIHAFSGFFIVMVTFSMAIKALNQVDWRISKFNAHAFFGLIAFVSVMFVGTLGFITSFFLYYGEAEPWGRNREVHLRIGRIHKFLAWRLLLVGFISTSTGLAHYQLRFNPSDPSWTLLTVHVPTVMLIVVFSETLYHFQSTRLKKRTLSKLQQYPGMP